jgi:SNF2 family DNA or RNA helicase
MEPGTGKTRTAIDLFTEIQQRDGKLMFVLTLCPLSAVYTWKKEFVKWQCEHIKVYNLNEEEVPLNPVQFLDLEKTRIVWYIASFGMIRNRFDEQPFKTIIQLLDGVVVDESVYIKNPEAIITKVVATGEKRKKKKKSKKKPKRPRKKLPSVGVFEHVRYKYILSGLPITRHLCDIYGQYRFLSKAIFGDNFYQFRYNYFTPDGRMFDWVLKPDKHDTLRQKYNTHSYRVKKADVLHDLPPKINQVRFAELSPKMKKVYKHLLDNWCLEVDDQMIDIKWAFTLAQKLQQLTSGIFIPADQDSVLAEAGGNLITEMKLKTLEETLSDTKLLPEPFCPTNIIEHAKDVWVFDETPPKVKIVKELLEELPDEQKVVIWCFYRADLALLYKYLSRHKGIYYHGGTSPENREKGIDAFIHDPSIRFAVLQIYAGMTSLNLQVSHNVHHYSHTHDFGAYVQAQDRNHRLGQKNAVLYSHIFMRNTVDDRFSESYTRKMGLMEHLEASSQGGKVDKGWLGGQ